MKVTDKITITNEDCMELLKRTPDNYYDLLNADPPYFSGPEKRKFYGNEVNKLNIKRIDYPITENWNLPTEEWFLEAKRVSKNQIIWGANYFSFIGVPFKTPRGNKINDFIKENPIGWIIWDKCNGNTSFNDYELAWTSFNRPTIIYKFMWNGMMQGYSMDNGEKMQGNKKLNQKKIHPTEKPVFLYDWINKNYTESGNKIISPYLGSGSDALSSLKFNIYFDGCELTKIHFNASIKRIQNHVAQQKLF